MSDVKSIGDKLREKRMKQNAIRLENFSHAAECFYQACKLYATVLEEQGLTGGFGLSFCTERSQYFIECKPENPDGSER